MVDRILIGKRPSDGTVGMWISKPGKDISSSNPDDFLFDPSKYMARAFMRVTAGTVWNMDGIYVTRTYNNDTQRGDTMFIKQSFPLPFAYVPLIIAQLGEDAGNTNAGEAVNYNASEIQIRKIGAEMYRYTTGDPNKTPIAGTLIPGYDHATRTYTSVPRTRSSFIVYRNPLF